MKKFGDCLGFCLQFISPKNIASKLLDLMLNEFAAYKVTKETINEAIYEEIKDLKTAVSLVIFMDGVCASRASEEYL